jgi:hypothetical protein
VKRKNKIWYISIFIILILISFIQCYKTAHDLHWTVEEDFDRDMSFVQGTLEGNFGKDPSYRNEFLWYNPLLFLIETSIVKAAGVPVNIVLARAGIYLNLLAPLAFACMVYFLFNIETSLAAAAGFLFFTSGNLLGWSAATYSPWLYPGCFMQFIFYLNIIICYKAFSTQKYSWFFLLGILLGISFLGHTAPTLLIILIMISIQAGNIYKSVQEKNYLLVKKFFFQGSIVFAFFILASFPLLFFIIGKYKLHMVNRITFEYFNYIFIPVNFMVLVKMNLSVTLLVSIAGFFIFLKKQSEGLVRKIILNWLVISVVLFIYSLAVPVIHHKYNILLPGFVPAFHFFFYLKALQSIFFAIGSYHIFRFALKNLVLFFNRYHAYSFEDAFIFKPFAIFILLISLVYFPVYSNRDDFHSQRKRAIAKANDTGKVEVYQWIVKNIPSDKVILCNPDLSLFPVLATGRKMVSTNATFSNPYLDFTERETDRMDMLSYLKSGKPFSAQVLFKKYDASVLLINNDSIPFYLNLNNQFDSTLFKNKMYSLLVSSKQH